MLLVRSAFLFIEAVFEEHENWLLFTIDVTVFAHGNHTIAVHGFTGEELQVLESTQDIFHLFVYIGFENVHLIGFLGLQFLDKSAHKKKTKKIAQN